MYRKGDTMKSLYILPILAVLPISAFAESDSYHIKPFVGYNLSLASSHNLKIKDDTGTAIKQDGFDFNDNNVGDFVLGIEIDDVVAISIKPSLSQTKTKVSGAGTTTAKMNEIDAEVDVYLMRNSNFKPYVSLAAGYASMDGDVKTSGAIFSFGLGCRQYMTNNFYLNANLSYKITTEMDIKEINGLSVDNVSERMSGFDLIIGAGYRF